jgi:hypothetical protein
MGAMTGTSLSRPRGSSMQSRPMPRLLYAGWTLSLNGCGICILGSRKSIRPEQWELVKFAHELCAATRTVAAGVLGASQQ